MTMGSPGSTAWSTLDPSGVLLRMATQQETGPPPTDGNLTTIFLGLTAFSLVIVVVGAWLLRSVRAWLDLIETKPARRALRPDSTAWPDTSEDPR
jgi:hypothetical protein